MRWFLARAAGSVLVACLALARAASAGVRADFEPPDASDWRHLGLLSYRPALTIKDFGRDSNVFLARKADSRSDVTATLGPSLAGLARFGSRGFLTANLGLDYVWFRQFHALDHANISASVKGNLNLRKLRFFAAGEYQDRKERPISELDRSTQRTDILERAGAAWEYSTKTAVDAIVTNGRILYSDADFRYQAACDHDLDGTNETCTYRLGDLLTRTETTATLRLSERVLGRTRLIFEAAARRYIFEGGLPTADASGTLPVVGSVRNSDDRRLSAGVEVEPGAALSGSLRLGQVDFRPHADRTRGQRTSEPIWNTSLSWRLGSRLAVSTSLDRDLTFSTFADNLYFRQEHAGLQCVYFLNRVIGLEAGDDEYALRYPTETPLGAGIYRRRRDDIRVLRAGVRYRIANRTTAALRIAARRRTSNIPGSEDSEVLTSFALETSF